MATFIILMCSYGEELCHIGWLYFKTGDSYKECLRRLLEERESKYYNRIYSTESNKAIQVASQDSVDGNIMCRRKQIKNLTTDAERIASKLVFVNSYVNELAEGSSFLITGKLYKYCERFSINLLSRQLPNGEDVAIHINPRFPQNYMVRNSKAKDSWGKEEVSSIFPFSLKRGENFSIEILVTNDKYLIATNGFHFTEFRHRVPFKKVNAIEVKGDVTDVAVEQKIVTTYPHRIYTAGQNILTTVELYEPSVIKDESLMSVPYYGTLKQNFSEGNTLYITGRVKILPHSFFLNLQNGKTIWPHPTVAFHFNPRFATFGGKHLICRNSWANGKWGQEERTDTATDFTPGQLFTLKIHCSSRGYLVFLNNKFILEYKHRMSSAIINTIFLRGDIKIYSIVHETTSDMQNTNSYYTYDLDEEE